MWLERMQFECVDGWQVQDANSLENPVSGSKEPLFSGSTALMQPQDVRQYIYILLPVSLPPFPITHAPGAILGLGRLDISWRSSYGEPGRLLTSVRDKHSSDRENQVLCLHGIHIDIVASNPPHSSPVKFPNPSPRSEATTICHTTPSAAQQYDQRLSLPFTITPSTPTCYESSCESGSTGSLPT